MAATAESEVADVKKEAEEGAAPTETGARENGTVAAGAAEGEGWADVDQELGDLLRDVEQQPKSSDDEDDSNTGRFVYGRLDSPYSRHSSGLLGNNRQPLTCKAHQAARAKVFCKSARANHEVLMRMRTGVLRYLITCSNH